MALKDELDTWVGTVFRGRWDVRDGRQVPGDTSQLALQNQAIRLDGTVLYADLADSTAMVDYYIPQFAAEVYKTFLYCSARIVAAAGGTVTAYDGDRIMAVFIGSGRDTIAVKAAMRIKWAVDKIVMPKLAMAYPNVSFQLKHVVGIDRSELFVAKTGARGANDLVWVGRAANYAAKLSALPPTYTYITADVFRALTTEAKVFNGKSMWESVRWNTFDDSTIYRSGWRWTL
ncbi:MAG: adenylate/guanylate cyclase domain-containing protein [Pseudomonadota bacterium]